MEIPDFIFPDKCALNGEESCKIFVELAAEGNRLPHEQCARSKECPALAVCAAEGEKQEEKFRKYKKPLKEKLPMDFC